MVFYITGNIFFPCRQLHIAAIHGCVKAISTLLKVCPNKELLNVSNDDGHTALHLAVMSGNAVVTRMLVIAGASLDARDRTGETPLHKATMLKNLECIKALLNPVQERPQRKYSSVLNQKNYNGKFYFHFICTDLYLIDFKERRVFSIWFSLLILCSAMSTTTISN